MSFKPTNEQIKIFNSFTKRKDNLIISALAGCGKTTTVVQMTKLIPKDKSAIFLAFNKHIQEELKERLPEGVFCYTFHGLGVAALKRKYGDSIKFDEFKLDQILKKKAKNWNLEEELHNYMDRTNYLNGIKKLVNLCRLTLTLDKKYVPYIAEKYDINVDCDKSKNVSRVFSILEEMMNDRKTFDFTDMVFLPAIDKTIWLFQHDFVFVDEIQDLNRVQQKLVEKMIKKDRVSKKITGRFIGVGDKNQAIYGFSGVSDKSFDWFLKKDNTKILPLTYTFRCAKNIVKEAQKLVPDIKALDSAPDGIVRNGCVLTEPEDGDFVLSRTTTPLVKLFFRYLLEHKKATIKGSDIGLSLIEMIDGHKSTAQAIGYVANQLENKKNDLKKRGILNYEDDSGFVALQDKYNVLDFLGKLSKDINDLKTKIKQIFRDDLDGIILSTVHKAKGLEANRVFIARPDKMPLPVAKAWQYEQELNLKYVAITRAKKELVFDPDWIDDD